MVTLTQFREITEGLPGDFEIRIGSVFHARGKQDGAVF